MAQLISFPLERAGRPGRLQGPVRALIPQVFNAKFPSTCGREDCAHMRCLVIRAQAGVLCCECYQPVRDGDRVHVTAVHNGFVTEQRHAQCPEVSQ